MSYESKALNAADDLLDAYPHAAKNMEALRNLLALAWLKGSQQGAGETLESIRADVVEAARV